MMYVAPIIDLWSGRPVAYVLTCENGEPNTTNTPRELYMYIIEAMKRDFTPIVVKRPNSMKDANAWNQFKRELPDLWEYEDGTVLNADGQVVMKDGTNEPVELCWSRQINSKTDHKAAMMRGVHYGSGKAFIEPEELSVHDDQIYQVAWGE